MFNRQQSAEDKKLADLIDSVMNDMASYGPDSPEYPALVEHLQRLNELKTKDRPKRISPDTMALVAGNLIGILIIVAYEQKHVMTSKSLNFIMKPKTDMTP